MSNISNNINVHDVNYFNDYSDDYSGDSKYDQFDDFEMSAKNNHTRKQNAGITTSVKKFKGGFHGANKGYRQ